VDLKDLFLGKVIEVEVDRLILCPKCDGSGAKSSKDVETCSSCGGRGIKVIKQMLAPGIFQQMQSTYIIYITSE
jgi:DnaJ-related protein SCJ1